MSLRLLRILPNFWLSFVTQVCRALAAQTSDNFNTLFKPS